MKKVIDQPTRGKIWDYFMMIGLDLRKRIEKEYFGIFAKIHDCDRWRNCGVRRRKKRWFMSSEDENHEERFERSSSSSALRSLSECKLICVWT